MRDFIIVAPTYTPNSNGIKTIHKICHTINKLDGTARMAFIASNDPSCQEIVFCDASWTNPAWNTPPLQESERHLIDNSYVLYPEIILGNPLNAKRVIRYFANREAYCNGKAIDIGADDFFVAHSHSTHQKAHCILFNSEVNPVFLAEASVPTVRRTLDVTYIGKGYLYGKVGIVDGTVLIGRDWPTTQEQLAIMLRNVRIFYTWDSWTSINAEAVLCGAVPFILRYEPWTEEDLNNSMLGRLPRLDEKNQNFDPVRFEEERRALRVNTEAMMASWDTRVHDFMRSVEKHFDECGL